MRKLAAATALASILLAPPIRLR
ncbi:hypothetical protein [Bradyrhizobium sp. 176]|nr:hypothetical protein [Bradyrhizobium sp. 176]MCK1556587.1 hypothetical protein [Bradyrhizobium sp. 171]